MNSLCARDLWHEFAKLQRLRTSRLREHLHLLVSAAAVTVDKGKAFEAIDEVLAAGSRKPYRGGRKGQPNEASVPLNAAEQADAAATAAAVEGLWATADVKRARAAAARKAAPPRPATSLSVKEHDEAAAVAASVEGLWDTAAARRAKR